MYELHEADVTEGNWKFLMESYMNHENAPRYIKECMRAMPNTHPEDFYNHISAVHQIAKFYICHLNSEAINIVKNFNKPKELKNATTDHDHNQ